MARLAAANQPLPRIWEAVSSHQLPISRARSAQVAYCAGPVVDERGCQRAAGRGRPARSSQVLVSKHRKLAGMFASSALSDERPVGECRELGVGHPAHVRGGHPHGGGLSSRRRRA